MSAAYVTISSMRGVIRKYGGNRNDVRALRDTYQMMKEDEFLVRHPYLTIEDFRSLKVKFTRKNR
ncbi:hypothetical protein JOD82_001954 [Paenibacillus sp. 1182]|uniref:hypothetical protein n=1 Tax=Paenibacillus sp. 1182 TaxID=2806565 RepID=UPI001AE3756E|nr:hypothetical protein [Paenibacillus sp. 1182]MBP1308934.1 hypothetical protein [Paenibacillus sp. 1182]